MTYDARGSMIEPHTGIQVGLGTLEVREYLNERAALGPAITLVDNSRRHTVGPENRYRTVLFVEKEGFPSPDSASADSGAISTLC